MFSVMVLSCTDGRIAPNHAPINMQAKPSIEMANARGLNTRVMDVRLAELIAETKIIQERVQILLARLNTIKNEIAYYNPKAYTQIIDIAGPPRTITLPVPERPNTGIDKQEHPIDRNLIKPSYKKPESQTSQKGVKQFRTGVHATKTRIVMDINGGTTHTVDFDKELGILTLTLRDSTWNTTPSKMFELSQLKGYQAKNTKQGVVIAMSVDNTQSVKTSSIKKTGDKPARLIVDLIK